MFRMTFLLFLIFPLFASGQIDWIDRLEIESRGKNEIFNLIPYQNRVVGFRTTAEKRFNLKYHFELFHADHSLKSSPILEIPIRDYYELLGYDLDQGKFYALFNKSSSSDKYIIEIDLETLKYISTEVQNVLDMEYKEFIVSNGKAIFVGTSDSRPIIQAYDLLNNSIYTFPEIYSNEQRILQVRKIPEFGVIDITVSKRDKSRRKQISLISFDEIGNKLRQIHLDQLDENIELIESINFPNQDLQNIMVGTFGLRKREAYLGNYLVSINEFGEHKIDFYYLQDYPNFYQYLSEKAFKRKQKELEKYYEKETPPIIRPLFTTREFIDYGNYRLIYNEVFSIVYSRNSFRDGLYYNSFYRFNNTPFSQLGNFSDPPPSYRFPAQSVAVEGEYKYTSAHFALIHEDGRVIWENAIKLPNKTKTQPEQFGQVGFDGSNLFFVYLSGDQISVSHLNEGKVEFIDKQSEFQLLNPNEKIKELQEGSLKILHWHDQYFLCSGFAKIKMLNKENKEETKEVFFIDKLRMNPVPKEQNTKFNP
jgi:hypothetical protein